MSNYLKKMKINGLLKSYGALPDYETTTTKQITFTISSQLFLVFIFLILGGTKAESTHGQFYLLKVKIRRVTFYFSLKHNFLVKGYYLVLY